VEKFKMAVYTAIIKKTYLYYWLSLMQSKLTPRFLPETTIPIYRKNLGAGTIASVEFE